MLQSHLHSSDANVRKITPSDANYAGAAGYNTVGCAWQFWLAF